MQVFVKNLAGETVTLEVCGSQTVKSMKAQLEFSQGVPAESMRVLFQGKNLDDEATLAVCELKEESTVHLVMDLDGGKKKKKKVYDKPKKQKHKNKKIKLRVLNFYKIEGDEIIRNRQECPKCGAGVFMASHRNRYYCGRCHYTSFRTEA